MILTEQQYKNLYRNYFYWAKTDKLEKASYDYFYLTNSFAYAATYACISSRENSRVYRFTLKEGLNIFNAHSKKDVEKLRLYFFKNKIQISKDWYWKGLEEENWNDILTGINNGLFIKAIKACNFDGFFNYKCAKEYKEIFKVEKGKRIPTAPVIGIFDIAKLKLREIVEYKNYFNYRDFTEEYNAERNSLIDVVVKAKERGQDSFELGKDYIQSEGFFLTEKDLDFAIKFDPLKEKYKRDRFEDAIYKKLQEKEICFDYLSRGYFLTKQKQVKCFFGKRQLQAFVKKYDLSENLLKNYESYGRDMSYRV